MNVNQVLEGTLSAGEFPIAFIDLNLDQVF
jgi:hypothetical protein